MTARSVLSGTEQAILGRYARTIWFGRWCCIRIRTLVMLDLLMNKKRNIGIFCSRPIRHRPKQGFRVWWLWFSFSQESNSYGKQSTRTGYTTKTIFCFDRKFFGCQLLDYRGVLRFRIDRRHDFRDAFIALGPKWTLDAEPCLWPVRQFWTVCPRNSCSNQGCREDE